MVMMKKGKMSNSVLKLDMSKAYERVEWDFLANVMSRLGFHLEWITLVIRCVCSVTYTVGLNNASGDTFSLSRGLRQRDSFSPYLFLICAEGFSTILNDAKQKGIMKEVKMGKCELTVNHLLFVDDCMLFGDASIEGAQTVGKIISEYESISGQKVNLDKSLIYFAANVDSTRRDLVENSLRVKVASNPEKYLGLPMMVGRRKRWVFA